MEETSQKTKVVRPDVVAKLNSKKSTAETVVKSSLQKYLYGPDKRSVVDAIDSRVVAYSKRANMASLAMSGLIKEMFATVVDVRTVDTTGIFDQTFVRQLFLGCESAKKQGDVVVSFFTRHPEYQARMNDVPRHGGDGNIYTFGARQYLTNVRNSLFTNITGRIKTFVKRYANLNDITDDEKTWMFYKIHGWELPERLTSIVVFQSVVQEVERHRSLLGLYYDANKIDDTWLKADSSSSHILRYLVWLNRFYQHHNFPTFDIVPIYKRKRHFITFDNEGLYGLMKELKMICGNKKSFLDNISDHRASFINTAALAGKNCTFTGTFQTDGVSLCTHFVRPKSPAPPKNAVYVPSDGDRVVGLDPGRTNIYYVAETNGAITRSFTLTRSRYYCESGIYKAAKQTERWNSSISEHMNDMSSVSTKGVDPEMQSAYMCTYLRHYDALWSEVIMKRWAAQRLRLYGGKKRTFAKFWNAVVAADPSKRLVVAYGAAKFASGGKGEVSVPTSSAFKECKNARGVSRVLVVDEFRTSRVSYEDDTLLNGVATNEGKRIRGLLWCGSTSKKGKFVNRDLNAALNIRRCAMLPSRPDELCRKFNVGNPLPRSPFIVKTIMPPRTSVESEGNSQAKAGALKKSLRHIQSHLNLVASLNGEV